MKIIKYKKLSNDKYKILLENNKSILLYENTILEKNLLITKKIDNIEEILKYNKKYDIYQVSLKYINAKMRSEKELRDYLLKKEYDLDNIDLIIDRLKKEGYVNDELYTKAFISDKIRINNYGQNKIINELCKSGINNEIIEKCINNIEHDSILNNINKIVDKKIKTNNSYAGEVLKQKIMSDLISKGYYKEDIINVLNEKNFDNNDLYEKEYKKLYNKYSKKYEGSELDYIIKQKLYMKGLKK